VSSVTYPWLDQKILQTSIATLPHAIIINGPVGVGKRSLVSDLTNNILLYGLNDQILKEHIKLIDSKNHPDLYELDKDTIKVGDISRRKDDKWDSEKGKRDAISFLNLTPSISKNKVLLMHNVDNMTLASQDALLKSLEEPAAFSYILMTTSRPHSLKSTIYSRCQTVNIKNPSREEINSWLEGQGLSDFSSLDFPSYFTPIQILDSINSDNAKIFKEYIELFSNYLGNKIPQNEFIKDFADYDLDLIEKLNFTVEVLKILLSSTESLVEFMRFLIVLRLVI
jgi:DNA polymerase III delta prime subunit